MWRFVGLKWEFHQHPLIEHKCAALRRSVCERRPSVSVKMRIRGQVRSSAVAAIEAVVVNNSVGVSECEVPQRCFRIPHTD